MSKVHGQNGATYLNILKRGQYKLAIPVGTFHQFWQKDWAGQKLKHILNGINGRQHRKLRQLKK
jgi:hypothetical protein